MPEYRTSGAYVEETGNSTEMIEGVATSTTGFVGAARFGPVSGPPMLITSFEGYQRHFGDAADLLMGGVPTANHLAWAVKLFFENGGKRVYVARIFATAGRPLSDFTAGSATLATSAGDARIVARDPGLAGDLSVRIEAVRSGNIIVTDGVELRLTGVRLGDVVEINTSIKHPQIKADSSPTDHPGEVLTPIPAELAAVSFDSAGKPILTASTGPIPLAGLGVAQKVTFSLIVEPKSVGTAGARTDQISELSAHPDSECFVGSALRTQDPPNGLNSESDDLQRILLSLPMLPSTANTRADFAGSLLRALVNTSLTLAGGSDGGLLAVAEFAGSGSGATVSGLLALSEVENIAIVAAPGSAALAMPNERKMVRNALIAHCELLKYRFAVLAAENTADVAAIRETRSSHNSKYAALYHPWLIVPNAAPGVPNATLAISPEGAICGIFARSDTERGVHKAPANEVLRGALRFSTAISGPVQDVLNPEGINCLRSFEGRGNLVWGARTTSNDPEWIYINIRRLAIYLEHSIVRGTSWAVFEPNDDKLWRKIRLAIEAFLLEAWRNGALAGIKPEEAFFVRCDHMTMSQNDLDEGRLICLVGFAPIKPAEFLILRIMQWTAPASIL